MSFEKLKVSNMGTSLVCKVCGFVASNNNSLSAHIRNRHKMTVKDYFDKYIEPWEHRCIRCGKPTRFKTLSSGYRQACDDVLCMRDARRDTCLQRYGESEYHNLEKQLQTIKATTEEEKRRRVLKGKATKKEKYGNENYQNVAKIRESCLKKYGVDCVFKSEVIKEKIRRVNREKRGVDYPSQSPECRRKTADTTMKHYGVSNCAQSKKLQEKARQTRIARYGNPNYRNSEKQKITVARKSKEERESIIAKRRKTCLDKYGVDTPFGFCPHPNAISGLSKRVRRILDAHPEIEYIQELRINFKKRKEYRDFRAYDFAFGKTILELNGDYFHANPSIYKEDDIITIRRIKHTAQSIWDDDKIKRQLAESRGYRVVYLWEKDMKRMKDDELLEWILNNCIQEDS